MVRVLIPIVIVVLSASILVAADGPAERVVIPAAASSSGVQGSYWQTELIVFNPTDELLTATVEVLPALGDVAPPPSVLDLPIPPNGTRAIQDVLGTLFPDIEFGALVVSGSDPDGKPVRLVASSRTWSLSDDAGCGQTLGGLAWNENDPSMTAERRVEGLVSGPFRRANLGIVNLAQDATVRFEIEISRVDGVIAAIHDLTLPPRATRQLTDIIRTAELEDGRYNATVRVSRATGADPDAGVEFMVYGSVVDRQTSRPSTLQVRTAGLESALNTPPAKDGDLADGGPAIRSLMVVGMAAEGSGESQLSIENLLPRPTVVHVEIYDRLGFLVREADRVLPPGTVKDQQSVLSRHGLVGDGYSARVTLVDPMGEDIRDALRVSGVRTCGDDRAPVELAVAPVSE